MYKEELAKKQRLIEQLTVYDIIVHFYIVDKRSLKSLFFSSEYVC